MVNPIFDDFKGKYIEGCKDLEQNYTEEQSRLVSKIKISNNYFDVLGVSCDFSTKEINNAYTRLAKKVHPNNNKAPGSDEAFRKVQEAYECLSHTGKYLRYKFLYRLTPGAPTLCEFIIAFLVFAFIIWYLVVQWINSFPYPPYFLEVDNTHNYKSLMMTNEHGINFYVESLVDFNEKYPVGTSARADIEYKVINDYIKMVQEYCNDELRWHSQRPEFPTPACDKLQPFRTHI